MSILSCPQCEQTVGIPDGTPAGTRVQCPLCQFEFAVEEPTVTHPPMVKLISPGGGEPAAGDSLSGDPAAVATPTWSPWPFAGAGQSASGAGLPHEIAGGFAPQTDTATDTPTPQDGAASPAPTLTPAAGTSETPATPDVVPTVAGEPAPSSEQMAAAASATAGAETAASPDTPGGMTFPNIGAAAESSAASEFLFDTSAAPSGTRTRGGDEKEKPAPKKRKQPTMAQHMVQVVLGGIGAVVIVNFILWWGMGQDPFGIARSLPRFLAFLAPAKLREPPPPVNNQAGNKSRTSTPKVKLNFNSRGTPSQNNPPPDLNDLGGKFAGAVDDDISKKGDPSGNNNPFALVPTTPDPFAPVPEPTDFVGVRNAPKIASAEMGRTHLAARRAHETWKLSEGRDDTTRLDAQRSFYRSLCKLAHQITFVEATDGQHPTRMDAVRQTLIEYGEDPAKAEMLAAGGASWLVSTHRDTEGIFLLGTVAGIRPQGKLFETRLVLANEKKTPIVVMSLIDPLPHYQAKDHVVILGTIVRDPLLNLGGYEGSESTVIWGGFAVRVLPPDP
jgi:hypothetical protein